MDGLRDFFDRRWTDLGTHEVQRELQRPAFYEGNLAGWSWLRQYNNVQFGLFICNASHSKFNFKSAYTENWHQIICLLYSKRTCLSQEVAWSQRLKKSYPDRSITFTTAWFRDEESKHQPAPGLMLTGSTKQVLLILRAGWSCMTDRGKM